MRAIYSPASGYCVLPDDQGTLTQVAIINQSEVDPRRDHGRMTLCDDWQEVNRSTRDDLVDHIQSQYWLQQAISLVEVSFQYRLDSVFDEVAGAIEELLLARVSPNALLSGLLCAPLAEPRHSDHFRSIALSHGANAFASVLDRLSASQPLLRRFCALWISIPEQAFFNIPTGRAGIWSELIERQYILRLLDARNQQAIQATFGYLAFSVDAPAARESLARIGIEIAKSLFPGAGHRPLTGQYLEQSGEVQDEGSYRHQSIPPHEAYHRAITQIKEISHRVEIGDDTSARRFLRDLIQSQVYMACLKTMCQPQ